MKRTYLVPLLFAFVFAVFLAGCWNPFKPTVKPGTNPGDDQILPRTTPQNVLHNFLVIYSVKDNSVNTVENAHALALDYRDLLHPDFKFYFASGDVMPNFPEGWWGKNDEVMAFDSMMVSRAAGSTNEIQLSWTPGAAGIDNRTDGSGVLLHPTWLKIKVSTVLLDVIQGETTYRVSDGTADFYFAPDPADTTLWVISEWDDYQPSSA